MSYNDMQAISDEEIAEMLVRAKRKMLELFRLWRDEGFDKYIETMCSPGYTSEWDKNLIKWLWKGPDRSTGPWLTGIIKELDIAIAAVLREIAERSLDIRSTMMAAALLVR